MRIPKYLLYSAELVVLIWGINGVLKSRADIPDADRSAGTMMHVQSQASNPVSAAATISPSK